jgi:hypothetical protein
MTAAMTEGKTSAIVMSGRNADSTAMIDVSAMRRSPSSWRRLSNEEDSLAWPPE